MNITNYLAKKLKRRSNGLSKREDFDKMVECFTDSNGKRYYKYLDPFQMPIMRNVQLGALMMQLGKCIDTDEEQIMWDMIEQALQGNEKTNGKPDIAMIGFLINERKARKEMLVHEDLMLKIQACLYIREDQDPNVWDEELEVKKCKQFRKDIDDLYLFFCESDMNRYYPTLKNIKKEYNRLSSMTKSHQKKMKKFHEKYGLGQL